MSHILHYKHFELFIKFHARAFRSVRHNTSAAWNATSVIQCICGKADNVVPCDTEFSILPCGAAMHRAQQRKKPPGRVGRCGMHIHILLCLLFAGGGMLNAQTPHILWYYDTRDAAFGQTAAGDVDGDGKYELVFGCYRNDSSIHVLNAEDGSLLWKYNARVPGGGGCNDAAPLLLDVNGDGIPEVIVASSCNPTTYCFDGKTGIVLWETRTRGSDSPPVAADLTGDGEAEILHGEMWGWVRCIRARDGATLWDLAVDTRSWIQTAPTVLDVDADGELDFIVATWNSTEGDVNTIRAYRASDQHLLWSTPLADVTYHGTTVVDLDRDGLMELVIGDYSGTLTVLNAADGSLRWTLPSQGPGHYIGAPVSAGDLNGNGFCELIAVSWFKVMALDGAGKLLWEHVIDGYGTAFRGVVLADVDDDGLPDAVFGTSNGKLIALRGYDGALLWSVDLAAHYGDQRYGLDHAPVIADFTGDGALDVFIAGGHTGYPDIEDSFGRAYMLSIGRGQGPEWLMFQQNQRRDGSICTSGSTAISLLDENGRPTADLYPMPVRDEVRIEAQGMHSFRIVDASGREALASRPLHGRATVNISSFAPGIYFLLAEGNSALLIRSFVKL
jgi:outer membrane protein assembly factor BamB